MGVMLRIGGLDLQDDVSPADWLADLDVLGGRVGSLVPTGFEAYARILHPAYRSRLHRCPVVTWAEVARANGRVLHSEAQFGSLVGWLQPRGHEQSGLWDAAPDEGRLPIERAATLGRLLSLHTSSPFHCWFGVWRGWGDLVLEPPSVPSLRAVASNPGRRRRDPGGSHDFPDWGNRPASSVRAPTFSLPGREYYLLSGPVGAATESLAREAWMWRSANLWWPDDHAWTVATEVDLSSTYVGGSSACIADLLENPGLEVLSATAMDGITAYSDRVNPVPA